MVLVPVPLCRSVRDARVCLVVCVAMASRSMPVLTHVVGRAGVSWPLCRNGACARAVVSQCARHAGVSRRLCRKGVGVACRPDPVSERPQRLDSWVSIAYVSRILWVGVGAAGGIYVYRKTTQTIEGARQRTVRENLTRVAKHASNVAASARYLAALNGDDEQPEGVVDIRKASGSR